jgi:hypothetical protein
MGWASYFGRFFSQNHLVTLFGWSETVQDETSKETNNMKQKDRSTEK